MGYIEIYCNNCSMVLGTYNTKYYTNSKIWEVTQSSHTHHVRDGHVLKLRRIRT